MIFAFTGKTGSGKTYSMAKAAYKRWKRGEDLYTNTYFKFCPAHLYNKPIDIENCPELFTRYEKAKYFVTLHLKNIAICNKIYDFSQYTITRGRVFMFEEISEVLEVKNGVLFFDEGQSLFEARNWENMPFEFSNKLRQHRKHRLDLYVTTQNLGTIDINYRRLVQNWIHCECVFQLGRSPRIWFGLFLRKKKDIDELYNNVDDLKVTTLKTNFFFIHAWSRILYDTMYDIGFKRFKIICLTQIKNMKTTRKYLIIPKRMSLSNARSQLLLHQYFCAPNSSKVSKRT